MMAAFNNWTLIKSRIGSADEKVEIFFVAN